ncbi:MAG: histidine kinase dimerization/phosphoacceptor domain -containing protein [Planctomycetota bacterium]
MDGTARESSGMMAGAQVQEDGLVDSSREERVPAGGLPSADMLRQIFDASPSAMLLVAGDGGVRLANVQACRLFGYRGDELVGSSVERLVPERFRAEHPERRRGYFVDPVVRAMGEGRDLFGLRRDGSEVPIEIGLNPIRTSDGTFVLAAIIDISARKRSEAMLRASLLEKETLLREIHHRVKNNMQVVSSLLSLQTNNVEDEKYRALFEECQTRVRTMALIHEKLYSSGNLASLDGGDYVRELVQMLSRSYLPNRSDVRVQVHAEPLVLDVQVAIPIGLILHELITNALKHAFADAGGTVQVRLEALGERRGCLEVVDDGRGLPPEVAIEKPRTRGLGFRMVQGLVRQIDGDLQVHRAPGSRFRVEFDRAFHQPLSHARADRAQE